MMVYFLRPIVVFWTYSYTLVPMNSCILNVHSTTLLLSSYCWCNLVKSFIFAKVLSLRYSVNNISYLLNPNVPLCALVCGHRLGATG
jgi:hypothetical protein